MKFLLFYLFAINYIAYTLFVIDKDRALKGKQRIAEKNLLTACFLGGSIGGWLAMRNLRHKTSKQSFKMKFYAILIIQVVLFFSLFKR